jgi:hypothetical protein
MYINFGLKSKVLIILAQLSIPHGDLWIALKWAACHLNDDYV